MRNRSSRAQAVVSRASVNARFARNQRNQRNYRSESSCGLSQSVESASPMPDVPDVPDVPEFRPLTPAQKEIVRHFVEVVRPQVMELLNANRSVRWSNVMCWNWDDGSIGLTIHRPVLDDAPWVELDMQRRIEEIIRVSGSPIVFRVALTGFVREDRTWRPIGPTV